jgi:hypothetical protein
MMGQKRAHVDRLRRKAVARKKPFYPTQAQQVPIIVLSRPNNMFRNLIHLEKTQAHSFPRDAANFPDGLLQAGQREVFEQIMNNTKIVRFGRSGDFEDVPGVEIRCRKKPAGVLDVFLAKVKPGILEQTRQSVSL